MSVQIKSSKLPSKGKRLRWKSVDEFMTVKIMPIALKGKVIKPVPSQSKKVKSAIQPKLIP